MKNKDIILKILIAISIILILYSLFYFINYYSYNDILFHFPQSVDNKNIKLPPNEIGDSIGGILNPIIGFTASVLTFLAFYIQYKANNEQREIFNNTQLKEKLIEHKKHQTNINIFKALINSMIKYYEESGNLLNDFIKIEEANPLKINMYSFVTNSSYENLNKLNLRDIYSSITYSFENKDNNNSWENDFIKTLNKMDFYDKLVKDLKTKFGIHVSTKSKNLNSVGEVLNKNIGNVLVDEQLSSLDGINDYLAIVYNKNNLGESIIPDNQFEGADFEKLQDIFFKKFLANLKSEYDKEKDPKFKNLIDFYSFENKRIGRERFQTKNYLENLRKQHSNAFGKKDNFTSTKDFLDGININPLLN
jgi:hypothetical protein